MTVIVTNIGSSRVTHTRLQGILGGDQLSDNIMVFSAGEGEGLHHGRVSLSKKTGKTSNRRRAGSGGMRLSSRPTSRGRLGGTLGSKIVGHVRRNNPLLMPMSA